MRSVVLLLAFQLVSSEKQLITWIVVLIFAPAEQASCCHLKHLKGTCVVTLSTWKEPEIFPSKIFIALAWSVLTNLQMVLRFLSDKVR